MLTTDAKLNCPLSLLGCTVPTTQSMYFHRLHPVPFKQNRILCKDKKCVCMTHSVLCIHMHRHSTVYTVYIQCTVPFSPFNSTLQPADTPIEHILILFQLKQPNNQTQQRWTDRVIEWHSGTRLKIQGWKDEHSLSLVKGIVISEADMCNAMGEDECALKKQTGQTADFHTGLL